MGACGHVLEVRTKLKEHGRLIIPLAIPKASDLRPGDDLVMRVQDGQLRNSTRRQALARAREMIRRYVPAEEDLTQDFIDDRRREAGRE